MRRRGAYAILVLAGTMGFWRGEIAINRVEEEALRAVKAECFIRQEGRKELFEVIDIALQPSPLRSPEENEAATRLKERLTKEVLKDNNRSCDDLIDRARRPEYQGELQ